MLAGIRTTRKDPPCSVRLTLICHVVGTVVDMEISFFRPEFATTACRGVAAWGIAGWSVRLRFGCPENRCARSRWCSATCRPKRGILFSSGPIADESFSLVRRVQLRARLCKERQPYHQKYCGASPPALRYPPTQRRGNRIRLHA